MLRFAELRGIRKINTTENETPRLINSKAQNKDVSCVDNSFAFCFVLGITFFGRARLTSLSLREGGGRNSIKMKEKRFATRSLFIRVPDFDREHDTWKKPSSACPRPPVRKGGEVVGRCSRQTHSVTRAKVVGLLSSFYPGQASFMTATAS